MGILSAVANAAKFIGKVAKELVQFGICATSAAAGFFLGIPGGALFGIGWPFNLIKESWDKGDKGWAVGQAFLLPLSIPVFSAMCTIIGPFAGAIGGYKIPNDKMNEWSDRVEIKFNQWQASRSEVAQAGQDVAPPPPLRGARIAQMELPQSAPASPNSQFILRELRENEPSAPSPAEIKEQENFDHEQPGAAAISQVENQPPHQLSEIVLSEDEPGAPSP